MDRWSFRFFMSFVTLSSAILFCDDVKNAEEYQYMNQLALAAATDKSSSYHNYTEIYSQYFADLKDKSITFLEIGIHRGNSVRLWENYFPNAQLHFIDISSGAIEYYSNRSQYHFLDQTDIGALKALGNKVGGFDLILDDGGHTMNQQLTSFKALFPFINSGGMYIIEDLHTSYWAGWGGYGTSEYPKAGPGTTIDYLKNLVDDLNYTGANSTCADFNKYPPYKLGSLTDYQKKIYSIHFYDSVCIIKKR